VFFGLRGEKRKEEKKRKTHHFIFQANRLAPGKNLLSIFLG
jgi:hypothetical protein